MEGPRVRIRVKGGGKEGKGMDEGRRLRTEKGGRVRMGKRGRAKSGGKWEGAGQRGNG